MKIDEIIVKKDIYDYFEKKYTKNSAWITRVVKKEIDITEEEFQHFIIALILLLKKLTKSRTQVRCYKMLSAFYKDRDIKDKLNTSTIEDFICDSKKALKLSEKQ